MSQWPRDIKGNEHIDKLAKEAAQEAKDAEQLPAVISLGDVKSAAKESGKKKWQNMWDKSDMGRHLYMFRPKVDHKTVIWERFFVQSSNSQHRPL